MHLQEKRATLFHDRPKAIFGYARDDQAGAAPPPRGDAGRAEMWLHLRTAQAGGLQFRRQHPIGPFIVDFYCAALRLAIELDGDSHGVEGAAQRDAARTAYLEAKGLTVLRFWNGDVHANVIGVVESILLEARRLQEKKSPPLEREG